MHGHLIQSDIGFIDVRDIALEFIRELNRISHFVDRIGQTGGMILELFSSKARFSVCISLSTKEYWEFLHHEGPLPIFKHGSF